MAKRLRERAAVPDNVIPLHNPEEDRVYDEIVGGVTVAIESVGTRSTLSEGAVCINAFQACAAVLAHLEAQLIERGYSAGVLDLVRQTRADAVFEMAVDRHAEGCTNTECDTRRRLRAARRRYAPAVRRMEEVQRIRHAGGYH